jgi:hypothetical protein
MKNSNLLFSFLLLLFACNSNNEIQHDNTNIDTVKELNISKLESGTFEIDEESFGSIIKLKGKEQKLDAVLKPSEAEMIIKGDILIFRSLGSANFFYIFSLPDFKLVHSFGNHGGGPDEFYSPNLVPTDEEDKICYIYDYSSNKLSFLTKDNKVTTCDFSFPKGKMNASLLKQIHVLSNKEMLYACAVGKGKGIFRFNTDSLNTEIELSNLAIDKNYNNWAAYEGSFGVNKKMDRMVFAYKYFREIKFLTLSGTNEKNLVFDYEKPRPGDAVSMLGPDNITYNWKMSQTDESIYLSYSGRTPIEVTRDFNKDLDYIYIEEFDWNGNPKRKFKLDKWGYFCVDGKRNKLYLLATNADEPFYVYDLPE